MKSILILDKVLLHNTRQKFVTGAERFNLALSVDLAKLGFSQTIPAATSWKPHFSSHLAGADVSIRYLPPFRVGWINGLLSLLSVGSNRFDYLFLTNVGDAVIFPTLQLAKKKKFKKLLILAHRSPSELFLKKLQSIPATVLTVNNQITAIFRRGGYSDVHTYYGVMGAETFKPDSENAPREDIKFVVFGSLDSSWKGADTAVRAFQALPESVQKNSSLHLAGYSSKLPSYTSQNIVAYPWIEKSKVPEFLRSMDVMIVPSRDTGEMKETFSQSIVQGMLCGLPIIGSSVPIVREKIEDEIGLIFDSEETLAKHMAELHGNQTLRKELGKRSRNKALDEYVWDSREFADRFLT